MLKIKLYPYKLYYKYPFQITHTHRTYTELIYIRVFDQEFEGWGEAIFPPYVSEDIETSFLFFEEILINQLFSWDSAKAFLDIFINQHKQQHPAKCAGLEMAIFRYFANKQKQSLATFLKIPFVHKESSVTLSISSPSVLRQKIEEYPNAAYFKLKVDANCIESMIDAYLSSSNKPFVVDANQGFTKREDVVYWLRELSKLKVAYFEQPFNKHDLESHQWLRKKEIIPIIADETFQSINDCEKVVNAFDGVNVKLMKCGGIVEAQKIIQIMKKTQHKIIIGCMSDSSIAIQAASILANEVDFFDLDGPLLAKNDPFLHLQQNYDCLSEFLNNNML